MQKISLNNKTIFVTGAAGFIGSNLVKRLLNDVTGAKIIGIDNMNDYYDVSIKEYRLNELKELASVKTDNEWIFVKGNIADRTLIDVSQGYSGCSICSVCDRGIITADRKIACKAEENGIDALLITHGNIILPGFDCGFIGGASFFWDNTVYFFGTISNHPDYSKIIEFCKSHGADIAMLTHDPLTDYGSAIVIG